MESYVRIGGKGLKNLTYPYMGVGGGQKLPKNHPYVINLWPLNVSFLNKLAASCSGGPCSWQDHISQLKHSVNEDFCLDLIISFLTSFGPTPSSNCLPVCGTACDPQNNSSDIARRGIKERWEELLLGPESLQSAVLPKWPNIGLCSG